jgi:hypothetical protein
VRLRILLLALLGLAACPGTVNQANRLPASQPLREPVSFDHPGTVLHEPSGLEFAQRYGDFVRVSAVRFDDRGLDVGFGYDADDRNCRVVTTFYVYPTPRMSFIGAALHGASLAFHEGDEVGELRLFVYRHEWFPKYRFTYTALCGPGVQGRLDALIASMPWVPDR